MTDTALGFSHFGQGVMLDSIELLEIDADMVVLVTDEHIDGAAGDTRSGLNDAAYCSAILFRSTR